MTVDKTKTFKDKKPVVTKKDETRANLLIMLWEHLQKIVPREFVSNYITIHMFFSALDKEKEYVQDLFWKKANENLKKKTTGLIKKNKKKGQSVASTS